jgi:low-affinity ferrous iron transport protein
LMRQQLNTYDEALAAAAQLQSRARTHRRLLLQVLATEHGSKQEVIDSTATKEDVVDADLPAESLFGQFMTACAVIVGHIGFIGVYCAAIIVWLAFGPRNEWSNEWQLYINSATSALMVFVFSFLANIRERHSRYAKACLQTTFRVDARLELTLRAVTGDDVQNDMTIIAAPKVNFLQRAIYYYADVVGTLVGIAILLVVMLVWVAVGPVLHFNSNWWLLIGTYAGLVGLNDGFVLRNIQAKLKDFEHLQYREMDIADEQLLALVGEAVPGIAYTKPPLSSRISLAVGRVCAHELTVLAGVLVIFALIAGASTLRWNTTGQLICNVPPSIVESFFMIILITGLL